MCTLPQNWFIFAKFCLVVVLFSTTITVGFSLDNCLVWTGLDKYFPAIPNPKPNQKFWTQASTKLSFKPPTHSRIFWIVLCP